MSNSLYVMEAANIFCGDADPTASHHLTIRNLKLPELVENFVDHVAGGASFAIEVDTHINRLEVTFDLAGWDPAVMQLLASWQMPDSHFTCWGVIRDRQSGTALEGKAVIWGRLGRVNPQQWNRGTLQLHEYAIRGITHYELYLNSSPGAAGPPNQIYLWDFFENQFVVGGQDRNSDINTILRIAGNVATTPAP